MADSALSFAFHKSYRKSFGKLDEKQTVRLLEAMMAYAFEEQDTDLSDDDLLDMAWINIKPNIASSVSHSKRTRKSANKSTGKSTKKTSGKTDGESNPHRAERSGAEDYLLSKGKEVSNPTAASDGAAVAGATPPPLPDGFERTGVICSHAGCNERAIREKLSGTLWCPSCNAGELEMMGVEL